MAHPCDGSVLFRFKLQTHLHNNTCNCCALDFAITNKNMTCKMVVAQLSHASCQTCKPLSHMQAPLSNMQAPLSNISWKLTTSCQTCKLRWHSINSSEKEPSPGMQLCMACFYHDLKEYA